jgi:hypothetical protein
MAWLAMSFTEALISVEALTAVVISAVLGVVFIILKSLVDLSDSSTSSALIAL